MARPSLAMRSYQGFLSALFLLPKAPTYSFRCPRFPLNSSRRPLSKSTMHSSDRVTTSDSDSDSDVHFWATDEAEPIYRYSPNGYYTVAIGDRLGSHYRILDKLGYGSYSTVWLARDERLQRLVAIKVCTANASPREYEMLSLLNRASDVNDSALKMIPRLLNMFRIHGPHGTHMCLVTDASRCSLALAKRRGHYLPLILPVARAISAQLILTIACLHRRGVVHGDLHLGNILFKLPPEFHFWSDKELLEQCGEPELEPVHTDNKPIPPGVPPVVVVPMQFPREKISKIPLSDANIIVADFGESYHPSQESRLVCSTPVHCRPPESKFEPTMPKSFPSEIWTLACAIWATLSHGELFDMFFPTEDSAISLQVEALGKLPDEWWEAWDARSQYFTKQGQPLQSDGPSWTLDYKFEKGIQGSRRRLEMETMDSAEKLALLAMLRPMLAYRPEERCNIDDVLGSEWMTRYAMPDYEQMRL